jgi:hypothetical protein
MAWQLVTESHNQTQTPNAQYFTSLHFAPTLKLQRASSCGAKTDGLHTTALCHDSASNLNRSTGAGNLAVPSCEQSTAVKSSHSLEAVTAHVPIA